jgi:hypothetical protein
MFFNGYFFFENYAVYEIMWKHMVESDRPQITIQYGEENTRFACLITKARIQVYNHNI